MIIHALGKKEKLEIENNRMKNDFEERKTINIAR